MIALKYPLTGGPFGSPVFLSTSEIVPRFSCIASPHQRTNGRVFFRTGQFTPPDSSRRTIRFLAIPPSGRSSLDLRNMVRPFAHPAPPGNTSCHLPVMPRGTTSDHRPNQPLAEPHPAVCPSGPSRDHFRPSATPLPEPRPPIRLLTPGTPSAQERTVRNASGYTATPFVRPLQRFARSRPIRPPHLGSTRFRPSESHKKSDPGIALDSGITR